MSFTKAFSLSILSLVFAASAFAAPKVGDSATLDGSLTGQGVNMKITTFQKITAFDVNTAVYTVEQTQSVADQVQTKEVSVAASSMMSEESATLIVTHCASEQIGTPEHITVAAGSFDTCRVAAPNGSILWIAPIPFGVVKLSTAIDVGTVNLGASTFTRGK